MGGGAGQRWEGQAGRTGCWHILLKNTGSVAYDTWDKENQYITSYANTNLWQIFKIVYQLLPVSPKEFRCPQEYTITFPNTMCDIIIMFLFSLVFVPDQSCNRNRECVALTSHYSVATLRSYVSSVGTMLPHRYTMFTWAEYMSHHWDMDLSNPHHCWRSIYVISIGLWLALLACILVTEQVVLGPELCLFFFNYCPRIEGIILSLQSHVIHVFSSLWRCPSLQKSVEGSETPHPSTSSTFSRCITCNMRKVDYLTTYVYSLLI